MALRGRCDFQQTQTTTVRASDLLVLPRFVTYCCGSCGYALNLSSTDRHMTNTGSKYRKSIKKGIVSFISVDESRFSRVEELRCRPYFKSRHVWGFLRRRTKLFCRNCRNFVGVGYEDGIPLQGPGSGNGKKYDIMIRALQPSSSK